MAKVTGPLMSMDASGKFAGALVFSKWKGRPTVRQLVTPSNPQSAGQQTARNAMRALANGQVFANATALVRAGETITDKAELITLAPPGQAWNGYLVKSGIGAAQIHYDAATAIWTALIAGEKTAWDNAAAALVPAIPQTAQYDAGGGVGTPLTAGQTFLHYSYALWIAGAQTAIPDATPPVYA